MPHVPWLKKESDLCGSGSSEGEEFSYRKRLFRKYSSARYRIIFKKRDKRLFQKNGPEINLKYIEPSYLIRSVPANASDSIYCNSLRQYAVHAAMAGKTGILVALMKDEYVHLPLNSVASSRKIDPRDNIRLRVLETTGQPASMKN